MGICVVAADKFLYAIFLHGQEPDRSTGAIGKMATAMCQK